MTCDHDVLSKEWRFDVCEAYWLWLCSHHCGIVSGRDHPEWWCSYNRLSTFPERVGFKPADGLDWDSLTERGQRIYQGLCERLGTCGCYVGTVEIDLAEVIHLDHEGFLDLVSEKATGSLLLSDINTKLIGHRGETLILQVTGDASMIKEDEDDDREGAGVHADE